MQRNDDLIRELLLEFEAQEDWLVVATQTLGMSREERIRFGHINLLCDAGYMSPVGKGTFRITDQGHDFLAAIKNDGIWSSTKAIVAETGGSVTLEILKALASGLLKKKISEHTGIEI